MENLILIVEATNSDRVIGIKCHSEGVISCVMYDITPLLIKRIMII